MSSFFDDSTPVSWYRHFRIEFLTRKEFGPNEPRIVSDLKLREDNDDEDLEGVVNQEALEEAEIVSKGTKDDLETIVKY